MGPPITYMVDQKQYVAALGGGPGGGGAPATPMIYVFALPQ
jgi:hypothetical protein